jgi:hypothetical protein
LNQEIKTAARDRTIDLLEALLLEMRGIRQTLEGGRRVDEINGPDAELLDALHDALGMGKAFTAAGVLQLADERDDLRELLDEMRLSDATRLGRRLGRLRRKGYLEMVVHDAEGRWLTLSGRTASQRHEDA